MSPAPVLLDPIAFPLRGTRLIEASAGTGKTFTIAALYLRLVLGHGGPEAAFDRALTPADILVVTFTEAATGELRDRIRARLVEAADAFAVDPVDVTHRPAGADLLHDLRASHDVSQWAACSRRLRRAADGMDEASVSTIHAWCARMLREHAFDSGSPFSQALEADQGELLTEAVRDYWRTFFYPLDDADARCVRGWWPDPDALRLSLKDLFRHDLSEGGVALPPAGALGAARAERDAALALFRAPWVHWVDELRGLLDGLCARPGTDRRKLRAQYYEPWLASLAAWARGERDAPLDAKVTGWTRLTPAGLAEVCGEGDPVPDHPALHDMLTLQARLGQLPDGRDRVLRHAAQWVARRFAQAQAQRAAIGFDDLLARLAQALRGPNGARLAELIRTQFPVALIDEFQDTDATQYAIFDAIYGVAQNATDRALVLIGDPKQAIYAFRNADIHTYLAARRDTAGRHATLGTNHRSTRAMVAAVNHVFAQAESHAEGRGAFRFRDGDHHPLPFVGVAARGRDEALQVDGEPVAALTCWWAAPQEGDDAGAATRRLAQGCAAEVVRLLVRGQRGRASFVDGNGHARAVVPADIAILVNNRNEARAVRSALEAGGVRSVYLSDQSSVYASAVAADVLRWLEAIAQPGDGRRLRAALATPTLGLTLADLDRLNRDELHWDARIEQFRGYQRCWQRQGVLPAIRRVIHDFGLPRRLLAAGDERALTDLLHLAELLQVDSAQRAGEHALIRHLAEQMAHPRPDAGAAQLRLESDAGLVKVVTVHKSKGLEYPLVFVPFAHAHRAAKKTDVPLRWHEDGRLRVSLEADEEHARRMDEERLAEDLRKLYVALTRARHATWIGLAPGKTFARSAIGYLLTHDQPGADVEAELQGWADACEHIAIAPVPEADGTRFEARVEAPARRRELPLPPAREPWWIASYSSLRTVDAAVAADDATPSAEDRAAPDSAERETYEEVMRAEPTTDDAARPRTKGPALAGLHGFPRGAAAGNFLHGLLEWVAAEGFARVAGHPAALHDQVVRRCLARDWQDWTATVQAWLVAWLDTPWTLAGGATVAPRDIRAAKVELEFWFSASHVDTRALDAVVRRHVLPGHARPALEAATLNGMLKGFIDLVIEDGGRFHVVDYKSNWLGPDDAAYTPEAMRDAILAHRYDLQYALYLFALHRFLRTRLPDYDADRQLGGASYVFLRGQGSASGGVHTERPPRALVDELDALFTAARPVREFLA